MVNWKVRLKNRGWVMAFLSQVMLIAQILLQGLNSLGITDFQLTEQIQSEVLTLANNIFIILAMLGIIQDPTTKGYKDSDRAKKYNKPE
ncbi:phage holin [Mesobacillus foraminis]|uniref:phage holin n=1 Tax=Mesobacillus foraminis TaxID=279826 RepID=UPI001BEB2826|nr:phage holin [Mesobacillus foraminis]MBT2755435.1 phage holin [Mesobacillus foraminis]